MIVSQREEEEAAAAAVAAATAAAAAPGVTPAATGVLGEGGGAGGAQDTQGNTGTVIDVAGGDEAESDAVVSEESMGAVGAAASASEAAVVAVSFGRGSWDLLAAFVPSFDALSEAPLDSLAPAPPGMPPRAPAEPRARHAVAASAADARPRVAVDASFRPATVPAQQHTVPAGRMRGFSEGLVPPSRSRGPITGWGKGWWPFASWSAPVPASLPPADLHYGGELRPPEGVDPPCASRAAATIAAAAYPGSPAWGGTPTARRWHRLRRSAAAQCANTPSVGFARLGAHPLLTSVFDPVNTALARWQRAAADGHTRLPLAGGTGHAGLLACTPFRSRTCHPQGGNGAFAAQELHAAPCMAIDRGGKHRLVSAASDVEGDAPPLIPQCHGPKTHQVSG
jgi:hypothetical protein